MFAQMTMNRNTDQTTRSYKERIEEPVLRGLVVSTIVGALLGCYITFGVLVYSMSLATLAGAMLAGAAVGANAGLLFFGLGDVVVAGRLEADAELVEDADESEVVVDDLQAVEKLGQEDYAYTFRKAS